MSDLIEAAARYVRGLFTGESSGHDWWHTWRVWQTAVRLAEAEGADTEIVQLAALLHDVDDAKLSPETAAGKDRAVAFLREQGVPEEHIRRITYIIGQVSFKGSQSETPDSVEGMCVQDADRLDALGAVGIARTFAFGGSRGRVLWEPDEAPRTQITEGEYRKGGGCTVNHFYEKLLLLKDMMNTPTARAMAEARHRVMEEYLDEFFAEWKGER